MTNRERLDKFKTLYKAIKDHRITTAITEEDKFLGVVYKEVEIISIKKGTKDIADTHIFFCKVKTIEEYIEKLSPYIIKKEILIEEKV